MKTKSGIYDVDVKQFNGMLYAYVRFYADLDNLKGRRLYSITADKDGVKLEEL